MPPTGTLLSPTGQRVTDSPAMQLDSIAILRAIALATPINTEWDADDLATYLFHLEQTEERLREQL